MIEKIPDTNIEVNYSEYERKILHSEKEIELVRTAIVDNQKMIEKIDSDLERISAVYEDNDPIVDIYRKQRRAFVDLIATEESTIEILKGNIESYRALILKTNEILKLTKGSIN